MKAQIWSFDYVVSAVIFVTAMIIILFFWSNATTQTLEQTQLSEMQEKTLTVSDVLIRNPGSPDNWTNLTVVVLGLAGEEKILDRDKLFNFTYTDYTKSKSILGIGKFEFYFQLLYSNDTQVAIDGVNITVGLLPVDAKIVTPVERYVLLDGEIVKVNFYLWSR